MSSKLASALNVEIPNKGSSTNKLFHITSNKNINNCLMIAVGRDNSNVLSHLILSFNSISYNVISKQGYSINFFVKEGSTKEYYIKPITSYGSIAATFITNNNINIVDVTNTESTSDMEQIM